MKPDMFHLKKQALSNTPVGNWEIFWKYKNQIKSENSQDTPINRTFAFLGLLGTTIKVKLF